MQSNTEFKHNILVRLCFMVMFIAMFLGCTTTAQAGTLAYIQSSVDLNSWEVLTAVIRENVGLTAHSPEVRRVDSSTLDSLASNSVNLSNSISALSGLSSYVNEYDNSESYEGIKVNGNILGGLVGAGEKNRVLTFPGKGGKSETADYNRAVAVNDALIYDLNQSFSLWLEAQGYTKTPKLEDFYNRIMEFLNSINVSGDYCTVPGVDGEFRWRIAKGYTSTEHDSTLKNISDDADYVNWGMIVYEAFNNYLLEGEEAVTDQTVFSANPGQLEKTLVWLCRSVLDGLTSFLGLWKLDDLMFNTGIRANGYVGGIFPNSWERVIWTLFIIAEVLAAMILMIGIINRILQRAMTTLNTFARLRAMQQIEDIIVCAIALALLPLILRIIISMSKDFTGMIYTMIPENPSSGEKYEIAQMVSRYSGGGGTLAGCIAQFMFFGVQVYFNFFYMLRSLMVAFLIIIAPIMVSMVMVSDAKKQMAVVWGKELLANVLIQPIHAFIMATILLLPNSSHGFDNIIALYALIPLTAALRTMFFGGSGGFMDRAAETAKGRLTGSLSKGAVMGGAAGVTFAANKVGQVLEARKGNKGKGEGQNSGDGSGDLSRGGSNTSGNADTATGNDSGSVPQSTEELNSLSGNSESRNSTAHNGSSMPAAILNRASGFAKGAASGAGKVLNSINSPEKVAGLAKGAVVGAAGKAVGLAKGTAAGAGKILNDMKSPEKLAGFAKGAVLGVGAMGLATVGGALSGAGIQGGQPIAALGMNMANYRSQAKAAIKEDKDAKSPSEQQRDSSSNNNSRPALSDIKDNPTSIELGAANSGFENMGEVITGKNKDIVKQRYFADNDALNNMGIDNLKDTSDSITFTADPSKSPETAELGAYADYCQYLEKNGQETDRATLQRNTGVSATRTDDGVKVTINKKSWRAARNNGDGRYYKDKANIWAQKDPETKASTGLYIEGPKGTAQSLLGGIQLVSQPGTAGGANSANVKTENKTPHIVSFTEVTKDPEKYDPHQYRAEPDLNPKQPDTLSKNKESKNQNNNSELSNHDLSSNINQNDMNNQNNQPPKDDFDYDMSNFEKEMGQL